MNRKRPKELKREDAALTFVFVVGELLVGHSEPSLFEVFLAKALFPLSTFLYFP